MTTPDNITGPRILPPVGTVFCKKCHRVAYTVKYTPCDVCSPRPPCTTPEQFLQCINACEAAETEQICKAVIQIGPGKRGFSFGVLSNIDIGLQCAYKHPVKLVMGKFPKKEEPETTEKEE